MYEVPTAPDQQPSCGRILWFWGSTVLAITMLGVMGMIIATDPRLRAIFPNSPGLLGGMASFTVVILARVVACRPRPGPHPRPWGATLINGLFWLHLVFAPVLAYVFSMRPGY